MKVSYPFIVLCAVFVGGGIACLAFGAEAEAGVLFGIAGGQLLPSPVSRRKAE